MLSVRCSFLQGTYAAAAPGHQARPEWPPHPARFHAALLAGAWAAAEGEALEAAEQAALEWLETAPPSIAGPSEVGFRGSSVSRDRLPSVFVPRNPSPAEVKDVSRTLEKGQDASRKMGRTARVFPTAVPGDQPIWFIWNERPSDGVRATIERLLTHVQYLGASRSPVLAHLDEHPPTPWLSPLDGAMSGVELSLRVATPGTTRHLIANREVRLAGGIGVPAAYGRHRGPTRDHVAPSQLFSRLIVRRVTEGTGLDMQRAWRVARAYRAAILSQAGDLAPAVLHGHGPLPHCAFLPLPAVGHPQSGGRIMGLAVAVPAGLREDEVAAIERAVEKVSLLKIGGLPKPWRLETLASTMPPYSILPSTWQGPSTRWRSVTPVALDRHPKRSRGESVAELLARSVGTAIGDGEGAPEVVRAAVLHTSAVPGAPARQAFRQIPEVGLLCDAEIELSRPLLGPLVAGRARHFGVGLFLPAREGEAPR